MKKPGKSENVRGYRYGWILIAILSVLLLVAGCNNGGGGGKDKLAIKIQSPAADVVIYEGDSVDFQASVKDGADPYTYAWDFDSGATNVTVEDPGAVTFATRGTYTVSATVTDDDGDSDSATVTVNVILATTRDDKGVWFISGDPGEDLFYVFEAMGYAVATDRLWQAELFRRQAKGTLSEIFGAGASDEYLKPTFLFEPSATRMRNWWRVSMHCPQMFRRSSMAMYPGSTSASRKSGMIPHNCPLNLSRSESSRQTGPTRMCWPGSPCCCVISTPKHSISVRLKLGNCIWISLLILAWMAPAMFEDLRWTNDPKAQTYIVEEAVALICHGILRQTGATGRYRRRPADYFTGGPFSCRRCHEGSPQQLYR